MNTAKNRAGIAETRAKQLRPGDSGVFERFHGGQSLARADNDQPLNGATAQVPQRRDCKPSDLDRALSVLLHNSLRADGLASADAAAACDRQRQQVDEMRKADGSKRMSAKDLLKICGVCPSMRAATRDLLDQMETRER